MKAVRRTAMKSELAEGGFAEGDEDHVEIAVETKVQRAIEIKRRSFRQTILWLLAGALVLWYGDGKRHFIDAVLRDPRLHQQPFFVGCICVLVNTLVFLYLAIYVRIICKDERDFNIVAPGSIPSAVILGFSAYFLFAYAMWPIWGWLILLYLYILFMCLVVLAPYLPPYIRKED